MSVSNICEPAILDGWDTFSTTGDHYTTSETGGSTQTFVDTDLLSTWFTAFQQPHPEKFGLSHEIEFTESGLVESPSSLHHADPVSPCNHRLITKNQYPIVSSQLNSLFPSTNVAVCQGKTNLLQHFVTGATWNHNRHSSNSGGSYRSTAESPFSVFKKRQSGSDAQPDLYVCNTPTVNAKKTTVHMTTPVSISLNQTPLHEESTKLCGKHQLINGHDTATDEVASSPPDKRLCSVPSPSKDGRVLKLAEQKSSNASYTPADVPTGGPALNTNGKPRARRGSATDPQSIYARLRREKINERLKTLQSLVPNGAKVDIVTMLEEAINYVKFLQLQVKLLSSDEYWIYAPMTYNGMDGSLEMQMGLQFTS